MKKLLFVILCLLTVPAFADTNLSRDWDGQKVQGAAYTTVKSASIGTKSFKCFSTVSRVAWEVKVVATDTTDAVVLPFKYSVILSGVESSSFPTATAFFQFMNSPTSKSPTIQKVCLRSYSSATQKTAYGIFQ